MSDSGRGVTTKPVLVNPKEHEADASLRSIASTHAVRLLAKVRVADVIEISQLQYGDPLGKYALMAHFDFLLADDSASRPLLAVEIDGAQHSQDPTARARDKKKNELCALAELPLVRVTSGFGRREGRFTILEYVCEVFFRGRAFDEAQESGAIPWDEPFFPASFVERDESTGAVYFGSLDSRARADLAEAYKRGETLQFAPDVWLTETDSGGNIRADAFIAVAENRVLVATATVREFGIYGFHASELAEEVAVCDLRDQLARWLSDEPVGLSATTFADHFRELIRTTRVDIHSGRPGEGVRGPIPYPPYKITASPTYSAWVAEP